MLSATCTHFLPPRPLQDDVPSFPDQEAFEIIAAELGRPLEAVFSSISEQPVAAASLGQVCVCVAACSYPLLVHSLHTMQPTLLRSWLITVPSVTLATALSQY